MKLVYFFIIFIWMSLQVCAQHNQIDPAMKVPAHPRLLMTNADEQTIRLHIKSDKVWRSVHEMILHQCDSLLQLKTSERIMTGIRLDTYRYCLYRIFYLSYAWRITHEKKYFNQAEKELLAVCSFTDWNPSHFLDVAELTMAVAVGYDWLYKDLPVSERKIMSEAIRIKGITPSYDTSYHALRKWLSVTNNWNQVCNCCISYGAMAIYDEDPAYARKVINRSLESIVISMKDYGPDGAYAEGYGYWSYGTTYNIFFLDGLEKMFKTDFGLSKVPGFLKTPGYLENMVGPTGASFNYSDVGPKTNIQPAMFWFAEKLKNPSLLWNERAFLTGDLLKEQTFYRFLPAAVIWGNMQDTRTIPAPAVKLWSGSGKNPVALIRTSWSDPNALFVGLKGGSPLVTHGHMDIGSFVMESDGIRWAMDLGYQDYESLESKHIDLWEDKQDGQRWKIYRYNNFSHNTLTVNNELQRVKGFAPLTASLKNPMFLNAVTDISSSYAGQLASAGRGVAICGNKYVLIRDEIKTVNRVTIVRWSMLTTAAVKIDNSKQATLTKDGKKLVMLVEGGGSIIVKTWSTNPPHDYDAANPGTIIVGYEAIVPANTAVAFNVKLIPGRAYGDNKSVIKPLQYWKQ